VCVLGDSTCSVSETAAAIAARTPLRYCDPSAPVGLGTELHLATLADGSRVALRPSNGRERFKTMTDALYRQSDAFIVVCSELDSFDTVDSFAWDFVEQALQACERPAPSLLLIRTSRADGGHDAFTEKVKVRARAFAAETAARFTGSFVAFSDVSSASPSAELLAALELLLARAGDGAPAAPTAAAARRKPCSVQ
jgi:hypothetical protein